MAAGIRQLSETDICDRFITPALQRAGWGVQQHILREYTLRPGRMVVGGQQAQRDKASILRADYVLLHKPNLPLAVLEAKDAGHAPGAGIPQALRYAELLDVPFCFSSNGAGFVFRDATLADGVLERTLSADELSSPAQLWARYCAWKGWTAPEQQIAASDYAPSKTPRYY